MDEKPKGVLAAVAAAMSKVKRVAKDNRNVEQKYDFASVDDFMAMVGPICAECGLVTTISETAIEALEKPGRNGNTLWVRITYSITTMHVSGEALPPVQRHVEVLRSGPQAYGSAQSYVLKQYYRGLMCISTGERDDPDFGAPVVTDWSGLRDKMIAAVRDNGPGVSSNQNFARDLADMRKEAPAMAAEVDAALNQGDRQ